MLRVGLIGCGFMGTMHANCYKNMEGVTLAAVADIRKDKAEEIAAGTDAVIYAEGMDMIQNAELDIIDICLPTYLHAEHALAAMDKVKYLFIEKPVALTMEEGDKLLKKQEETGCQVQIGQVIRFWDEYVALREIVKSGKYGKVVNANFRRISPTPGWGWQDWLRTPKLSGGAAQDLHIHDVDFVLSLFGEPKSVYSVKNSIGEGNSYVNTLMQYEGFPVTVEGTWGLPASHPFRATFRVVFEDAAVENVGKLLLYTDEGVEDIVLDKMEIVSVGGTQGNISDLGAYYKELHCFVSKAMRGEAVEEAALSAGVSSLKFLLGKELAFEA